MIRTQTIFSPIKWVPFSIEITLLLPYFNLPKVLLIYGHVFVSTLIFLTKTWMFWVVEIKGSLRLKLFCFIMKKSIHFRDVSFTFVAAFQFIQTILRSVFTPVKGKWNRIAKTPICDMCVWKFHIPELEPISLDWRQWMMHGRPISVPVTCETTDNWLWFNVQRDILEPAKDSKFSASNR